MVSELQTVEEILMEELEAACVASVLTIREVCTIYGKTHKTVIDLIKNGRLVGRQASFGGLWLVSKRSCDERWPDGKR